MFVEEVAERAAALVLAVLDAREQESASPWLYGDKMAAEYLNWPLGRVQKLSAAGLLPCTRIGQRKVYRRDLLNRWLETGGEA